MENKEQSTWVWNPSVHIPEEYWTETPKRKELQAEKHQALIEDQAMEECEKIKGTETFYFENEKIEPVSIDNGSCLKLKTVKTMPVIKYTPPKKVKALWLGQTEGDVEIKKFEDLRFKHVGFIPNVTRDELKERYLLAGGHTYQSKYRWSKYQEGIKGKYYIFESARDLYLWMAEGEE